MLPKEACLDQVVGEVEDLAARVATLKSKFAKQKASVKPAHCGELEQVRTQFRVFKRHVQELEDAEEAELAGIQKQVEASWKELIEAVETLRAALS